MEINSLIKKRWFVWVEVGVVVVLISLAGYISIVSPNEDSQASIISLLPRPHPVPKPQPIQSKPGFETYVNTKYGFSFEYPNMFLFQGGSIFPKNAASGDNVPSTMVEYFSDQTPTDIRSRDLKIARTQSNVSESKASLGIHQIDKITYEQDIGGTVTDYIFSYKGLTFGFDSAGLDHITEGIITSLK